MLLLAKVFGGSADIYYIGHRQYRRPEGVGMKVISKIVSGTLNLAIITITVFLTFLSWILTGPVVGVFATLIALLVIRSTLR